ncbi:Zn-dependent hydrolase, glyoxylase family protein [Parvularcula bermudensis HTCC2503]|uniref:beta-lactamase n=1 Tax=Parvularcula bermudensis (strain ATCC BAA-594 / HTCC2503 / KCTC 12087) TaxID=314260 RepID=E0TBH6_PARBH|nr:MBL fold metallo-hydrolase [Parvularcula bermudensis]ADM08351.1 Zn-dependent hydrolase, glyoxylase family protein [Parvularcula bermudensis HTCC2503]
MSPILAALFATTALTVHPATLHPAAQEAAQGQGSQTTPATPESELRDLGDGLYMITGEGGNIMVSTGADGAFVIDDQFDRLAEKNLALIEEVSEEPIVFVLNTHYHGDHTGGNLAFYNAGATIIAHENVRRRLAEAADKEDGALPVITFSENVTFHWNDQSIRVMHVPNAHTDGDSFVFLPQANVIHSGDLVFSSMYPYIDVEAGGSVDGMLSGLNRIRQLANSETQIVPGHGPLSDEDDVTAQIDLLRTARRLVREQMMEGHDVEAVVEADPLADYNEDWAWRFVSGEKMVRQLFADLMATDTDAKAAVEAGSTADAAETTASAEPPEETAAAEETEEAPETEETAAPAADDASAADAPVPANRDAALDAAVADTSDTSDAPEEENTEDGLGLQDRLEDAQNAAQAAAAAARRRAEQAIDAVRGSGAEEEAASAEENADPDASDAE